MPAVASRPQYTRPQTAFRFYRSLRAVKVLLAALRSTLTVLAPQREVRIGCAGGAVASLRMPDRYRVSEMRRSSCAMLAFTRSSSSGGTDRPCFSSIK